MTSRWKPTEVFLTLRGILSVFLIFAVFDLLLGVGLRKLYFSQQRGYTYRVTKSLDLVHPDLLIVGSSCAALDFDSRFMSQALGYSVYNVGIPSTSVVYHWAVIQSALARYTPKVILLNLDAQPLIFGFNGSGAPRELVPYYRSHPEIRAALTEFDAFAKIKQLSNLYTMNEQFPMALWRQKPRNDPEDSTGFTPSHGIWMDSMVSYSGDAKMPFDERRINLYRSILEECKKRKISLVLVAAPYYAKFPDGRKSFELAKSMAASAGFPFLDHLSDTTFLNHREFFLDPFHLNEEGAEAFTRLLVSELRSRGLFSAGGSRNEVPTTE